LSLPSSFVDTLLLVAQIGGLPLYFEKQKLLWMNGEIAEIPPIYATFPTVKMGQMTLYDHHAAIAMDGGRPPFTLQAVDDVCCFITAIKYSQHIHVGKSTSLSHVPQSLSITAHRSGHVVGGAFYVLQRRQDETVVVVTDATYHIAKELHLDSSTLLQHAASPDVLITRPGGPAFRQFKALPSKALPSPLVSQAERTLTETVLSVLRRDGNVLLPVDCSGRVLELILLLNQEWEKQRLHSVYHLVWLAPMCHNVTEFARSQLEWMAVQLGTQFDSGVGHPYQLKAVRFCTSMSELNDILLDDQNPACVLASGLSLEGGPARDVLLKWADNPDNAVIFTDSSQCYLRRHGSKSNARRPLSSNTTDGIVSDNVAADSRSVLDDPGPFAVVTTQDSLDLREISTSSAVVVAPEDPDDVDVGAVEGATQGIGEAMSEAARSPWTTAGQLMQAWARAKAEGTEMDDSIVVDVNVAVRSPLAGAELKAFLSNEEAVRQASARAEEKRAMLAQVELAKGQLHLGEDETEVVPTTKAASSAKLVSDARPKKKSRFDSALFLKYSKPLHCKFGKIDDSKLMCHALIFYPVLDLKKQPTVTFEDREAAVGIGQPDPESKYGGIGESVNQSGDIVEDDYGISVQPERFTDIVSGVDPSKFATGSGRIGDDVIRRGLGLDGTVRNMSSKTSARLITEDEDRDSGDSLDERALEAMDLSEGNGIIRGRNGRPPTKVSTVPRKLEVLAEVSFIPGLEGRVDARAARQSVRALQPREVIVLGGAQRSGDVVNGDSLATDEVSLLAEAAKSFATGSKNVLTPSNGETAELTVGHSAFGVRLVDAPYLIKEEKEILDVLPEPVDPFEVKLGACNVSLVDCVATGQKVALDGSIVLAPRHSSVSHAPHSIYLSDGEVLLTDLRAELIGLGMKAEYSAHTGYSKLVVNGKVVVRKDHNDNSGRMHVEGPLCEDFYKVRSIVCGQYVVLSSEH
jgi:cleavage and polyadenylation specificity factor subunit 2